MPEILTLTLNPSIDLASAVETVRHTHKMRSAGERMDPGGGGINVARVLARLGCDVEALYLAGGVTGPVLAGLLQRCGTPHRALPIAGDTRISMAVHERSSGHEYRFVPQGPVVSAAEAQQCLALLQQLPCRYLVLSGSLPQGLPQDFYVQVVAALKGRGVQVVLDTSGPALKTTLAAGGVHLVKPSRGELEELVGTPLREPQALRAAAQGIVAQGGAQLVAVTLGHEGALLAHAGGVLQLPAIPVQARSAVGAGDSFVAAMTHGLYLGLPLEQAFRLGVAGGTAAVLTPGTDLCHAEDVWRLAAQLGVAQPGLSPGLRTAPGRPS